MKMPSLNLAVIAQAVRIIEVRQYETRLNTVLAAQGSR